MVKKFNRRNFINSSLAGSALLAGKSAFSLSMFSQKSAAHHLGMIEPSQTEYEAIVIGTGYGGAVTALRLGQAGVKTLLLEMGRLWDKPAEGYDSKFCKMTSPDSRSMWFKSRTEAPVGSFLWLDVVNQDITPYAGILDRVNYDNMSVYMGRGVGGGSLVNGAMTVAPKRDFLTEIMPGMDMDEFYNTYIPLAQRELGVNTFSMDFINNSDYYQFTRVSAGRAEEAGFKTVQVPSLYDFDYMQLEEQDLVTKSALGTEVIYGNNYGKKSLDKTYLAKALATGNVSLKYLHEVVDFSKYNESFVVNTREMDDYGATLSENTYTAPYLFCCAGSVGSTSLLIKMRESGKIPGLSQELGYHWGPNGNVMSARANHIWDTMGANQSAIPSIGIDNWDDPTAPVFAEIAPLPSGIETWISLYLAITNNPQRGYFEYDASTQRVELRWDQSQSATGEEMAKAFFDRLNSYHNTVYRHDLFGDSKAFASNFTYHPLGGCVMGKATDDLGQVVGCDRLYVNDGALISGNVGVNPFLAITALAERNINKALSQDILPSLARRARL